jgi:hypothetical protein
MLCEEGMITIEARSALSIPYSTKHASIVKTQSNIGKIDKHCIDYGMMTTIWRYVERRSKPWWQPQS